MACGTRRAAGALACAAALLAAACERDHAGTVFQDSKSAGTATNRAPAAGAPRADGGVPAAPRSDGPELARLACLSCHAEQMLAQQRLPKEKWAATVKKMVGWGAALEPADTETLVAYLAGRYGPDAGPSAPAAISAERAAAALAPLGDGAFSDGDAARGRGLFAERCASCHGPEARGLPALGLDLVERPLLYRAPELAAIVRGGRGRMPPMPATSDRELADLLAHLRTLRVP